MRRTYSPMHHRQSGVVMFIALIVLVAMTMAGLALIRSSSTGLLAAGNLMFKQNSVMSGDAGVEAAVQWIGTTSAANLEGNNPAMGYYAAAINTDETTWPMWGGAGSRLLATDAAGNTARVVIHRMCNGTGSVDTVTCTTYSRAASCSGKGSGDSLDPSGLGCPALPYYRVTARVEGPKNTVSYVQAMVY